MKLKLLIIAVVLTVNCMAQWQQVGQDVNGMDGESLGFSTDINGNGTTLVAGAWKNENNGEFSGKAQVFQLIDEMWVQKGEDLFGNGANQWFGYETSISNDGNTIAVTSLVANNSFGLQSVGIVQVFDWNGSSWIQRGNTMEGEGNPVGFAEFFGHSTSFSLDSNTIAIGGPNHDGIATDTGYVKVFQWDGNSWNQLGQNIEGTVENDSFGFAVAINANGTVVVAGAIGNDNFSTNTNGITRVYQWDGNSWSQLGQDIEGLLSGDQFGKSVAINNAGTKIIAGAPEIVVGTSNLDGTARVFQWNGSLWEQQGTTLFGEVEANTFGDQVSMDSTGNRIAVGAPGFSTNGSVQIFDWINSEWQQIGENIDGQNFSDLHGASLQLSKDGSSITIGAYGFDTNELGSGQVRVFNTQQLNTSQVREDFQDVLLFPNPTTEYIQIKNLKNSTGYSLFSILGQKVLQGDILNDDIIDLRALPSGTYILLLENNFQFKIVKN